ncbi:MAG: hypothetical protein RLZ47_465 [Bacteroidota bacterium]|jgi:hypothetical protein
MPSLKGKQFGRKRYLEPAKALMNDDRMAESGAMHFSSRSAI